MITSRDLKQIEEKNISVHVIEKQIDNFIHGFPFIKLFKPATPNDGILTFTEKEKTFYQEFFRVSLRDKKVVKFVPASGAASRMFKHLFEFREKCQQGPVNFSGTDVDAKFESAEYFLTNISKIAFFDSLVHILNQNGLEINKLIADKAFSTLLGFILDEKGLNYASLPKALITFHAYQEGSRTSAEEHLVEAAHYTPDKNRMARIHFTISPEHKEKFSDLFQKVSKSYELRYNVTYDISYSFQKPSTDILAVDEYNEPFRNPDGSLLFRPGGHGALLENLNEIEADLVFIKNIDNLVPDRLKYETFSYKELIGGYLLWIRERIFAFLRNAEAGPVSDEIIEEMSRFAKINLMLSFPDEFQDMNHVEKTTCLASMLSRPIRVCGMVKNEGEPGGGPFWVTDEKNQHSLQIVESSQVNLKDENQKLIWNSATHFNPVDLVCSYRDHHGNKYELSRFMDEKTGFISTKSSGGRNLKAQELPGLWNGSMAEWLTIFVEVPIITFNPVKTVNDLLRKEHLPS